MMQKKQQAPPYTVALCSLSAKYIHATLAPWCLAAGVEAHNARARQGQADSNANAHSLGGHAQDGAMPVPSVLVPVVVEATVNENQEDVLARILAVHPRAVGFACYVWNIEKTLQLAQRIKACAPYIVVILGGPEVSYHAGEVLHAHAQVDYILSGEGEESVPALLSCLARGHEPLQGEVAGLCTRTFVSEPCVPSGAHTAPPSPYTPAYLQALGGRIAYLETSRGCPFSCAFCLSGRCGAPRWFDLTGEGGVLDNLRKLANSGTQTVKLVDRTFNANAAHANAILTYIIEHYGGLIPAGVCFHFEIAADCLREDTMALLAQMPHGAVQLEIGMQSFCEKTLAAVRRKTDTARLQNNIRRLVGMGNMHVHIDLIAGLPHEDLHTFAASFHKGYALGAQVMQLGFLKLLHGAAMREEPELFPCVYSPHPPYEIISTPWLSEDDLALLRLCEDALERVYNSGRFVQTASFVLAETGMDAFSFYCAVGRAAQAQGLATHHVPLDVYTDFLQHAMLQLLCSAAQQRHAAEEGTASYDATAAAARLRDAMVCDRLATNTTGRLPAALQIADAALARAVKALAKNAQTAPRAGVKRGVALLYGAKRVCFVDYTQKNCVTGRYFLRTAFVDNVFSECYDR